VGSGLSLMAVITEQLDRKVVAGNIVNAMVFLQV
jgi:hypothetical protein